MHCLMFVLIFTVTGQVLYNISFLYETRGLRLRALECEREVLRILRASSSLSEEQAALVQMSQSQVRRLERALK
jgi:hypothetical protein